MKAPQACSDGYSRSSGRNARELGFWEYNKGYSWFANPYVGNWQADEWANGWLEAQVLKRKAKEILNT